MTQATFQRDSSALSREFAARLNRLRTAQPVRAIVLLQTEGAGVPSKRSKDAARQDAIEQIRLSAQAALAEVDDLLTAHNGKRLSDEVDALGSVVVETTAEGIRALAASAHVKAILEDQPIF